MKHFRSILSLVLVLVMTLLVSCGSPEAKAPPTYTPDRIAQVSRSLTPVVEVRERLPELKQLIQKQDWIYVGNFIHGPLGSLRHDLSYVARNLLPGDQPAARELAKDIAVHFEKIDAAAKDANYAEAVRNYNEVVDDLDTFIGQAPK
ncbi:MAG: photosystem II protein PsbQ [Oscillatoria sp. PMC 1051.18]|nr:photosystem II protein PsbQ [Oscillatoria sp. PMC 1050.18]MEC5030870.1 photosystem II protein PsbQ [Oscillatoria sp. PMC 1051.18]